MVWFRNLGSHRRHVRRHEQVLLYPSYVAEEIQGNGWQVLLHGSVFDPRIGWIRRRTVMGLVKRAMRLESSGDVYFQSRMERFLANFAGGRRLNLMLGNQIVSSGETNSHGLFSTRIRLTQEEFSAWSLGQKSGWIEYRTVLAPGDQREFRGEVQVVPRSGISIISDVDDTLKFSNVPNRRELFRNTFSRRFHPIQGMPEFMQAAAERGAVVHYVSGSPWQLFEALNEFWRTTGFPRGSFHLKPFRLRDSARKLRLAKQAPYKRSVIEPILQAFPQRKFLLIGDSGEQDPEIYGRLAADYPQQIAAIGIRATRQERPDSPRFQAAFASMPPENWHVFQTGDDLIPLLDRIPF